MVDKMKRFILKITLIFLHWFRGLFHYGTLPYFNCDTRLKNGKDKKLIFIVEIAQSICSKTVELYRKLDLYYTDTYGANYYYDGNN